MLYGQLTTLWKYTKCMSEFTGKVMRCDGCWEKGGGGGGLRLMSGFSSSATGFRL